MNAINKNVLLFIIVALAVSCGNEKKEGISTDNIIINESADATTNKADLPEIKFVEETHDFGKITQGEKVSYSFNFTNVGKSSLIISSAQGSCGCTVAQPPKEPIAPGQDGKIDVVFNSDGKSGKIDKKVTLKTNCDPNSKILTILADVITPVESEPNTTRKSK